MKVVHVNTYDTGGAFIAAHRIHRQMQRQGIDSKFLVLKRYERSNVIEYLSLPRESIVKISESIKYRVLRIAYKVIKHKLVRNNVYFSLPFTPYDISSLDLIQNADIVNLHFIAKFVSVRSLSRIKAPIVWTLHDESPFSGLFHYTFNSKSSFIDAVIKKYKLKRLDNLHFICPSSWIKDRLVESVQNLEENSTVIHNGISTKTAERKIRSSNSPIKIGYVSSDLRDSRKGTDLFLQIQTKLAKINTSCEFIVVGGRYLSDKNRDLKIKYLGFLKDSELNEFYEEVDLLLFTSRADNLPNVLLESLIHKTPVVSFNIGGVNNIITHGFSGYLIPPFDQKLFIKEVVFLLENHHKLKTMGMNGFRSACEKFEISSQTSKYLTHYQDIIS